MGFVGKLITATMGSFALLLVTATFALAVPSYDYCAYSLRGGGTLQPDNDVKANWDWLEVHYNWNITSSYPGDDYVQGDGRYIQWNYWRANGALHQSWFLCYGSGSSYIDGVWIR